MTTQKTSQSEQETKEIAKKIKKILTDNPDKNVVALTGNLGAGKTKLTQFLAKEFNIPKNIVSPTFLVMKKYKLSYDNLNYFYHVDAYRLENEKGLEKIGLKKIINNKKNLVIIEWADKVKKIIPSNALWISLQHGKNKEERIINIKNE